MAESNSSGEEEFNFDETFKSVETDANQEHNEKLSDDFVFPGCPLMVTTSSVFIPLFILKHKLSNIAAEDLLELLSAHFPQGHKAAKSLYLLKKNFGRRFQPLVRANPLLCSLCEDLLSDNETSCPRLECKNAGSPPNEFLMFNIEDALAELLRGMTIYNSLSNSKYFILYFDADSQFCSDLSRNFHQREETSISDIVNGRDYRKMPEMSQTKWNITVTLNIDGVSVFKTSRGGSSLWPVYLTINELPAKCR